RIVASREHTWRISMSWRTKRGQRSGVHGAKSINDGVPFTLSLWCGEQKRQDESHEPLENGLDVTSSFSLSRTSRRLQNDRRQDIQRRYDQPCRSGRDRD